MFKTVHIKQFWCCFFYCFCQQNWPKINGAFTLGQLLLVLGAKEYVHKRDYKNSYQSEQSLYHTVL